MRTSQFVVGVAWVWVGLADASCGSSAPAERSGSGVAELGPNDKPLPACPAPLAGFPLRDRVAGVAGCPSDVQTRAGAYDGYRVSFGCLGRGDGESLMVVRGKGSKTFRQASGTVPSEDEDEEKRCWRRLADLAQQTANVTSIHRSSRVHACNGTGYAIELRMHSFRDVDNAVQALGDWLARQQTGGEVLLLFEPKPDPSEGS